MSRSAVTPPPEELSPPVPDPRARETSPEHQVLVMEEGEASLPPPAPDANLETDWDWDADTIVDGQHCKYCGAREPLFKLEEGGLACGSCRHGRT